MNAKVLIVDDEESIRFGLSKLLAQAGYECFSAGTAEEGFRLFSAQNPAIILLDLRLPDMEGLDFLRKLKENDNYVSIIIMTAYGTIETAVSALKSGAENFLTKPIDPDGLLIQIKKTLELQEVQRRSDYLQMQQESKATDYFVGSSDKFRKVHEFVKLLAKNESTVLILGETGTGKGLYAGMIHNLSPRAQNNFVEINCAGISRELLESELFGYDKGAFTGAVGNKAGLFELANGGTLFLDEIGEMQLDVQAKLLKVIEDKKFRRLGGIQEKVVDVRVIAASNRDLLSEVQRKNFREDLFYRLNVINLKIPSLRELKEDILPMADYFLKSICNKQGKRFEGFTQAAKQAILNYSWPGNIREMINLIERSVILSSRSHIDVSDLGLPTPSKTPALDDDTGLGSLNELEKGHIRRVLTATNNNLSRAADILGITRATLYSKIKRYNLSTL
ncbi:sigma-54 dependent transcriptional regulator [bacterium]|nr:sigma-54 dependent transcriptional regulator [bacterium]MCI0605790.1 sigma-54 dependent transcriptional regulator [bacterium]